MRRALTKPRLQELLSELAHSARGMGRVHVFILGGGTAVLHGWRPSTIDADLFSDREEVFKDIQSIKEILKINVEFVRPEHFVPALHGSEERHIFIETIGSVSFFHYDPYAQFLSKVVRGFDLDVQDAKSFVDEGLVNEGRMRELLAGVNSNAYAKYPALSQAAVATAVDQFFSTA